MLFNQKKKKEKKKWSAQYLPKYAGVIIKKKEKRIETKTLDYNLLTANSI